MKGFPKGYEAQINSTFPPDPQRTGSLYNFEKITKQLVPADTWFTQEVIAKGNHPDSRQRQEGGRSQR
jgi:hypothetical protein